MIGPPGFVPIGQSPLPDLTVRADRRGPKGIGNQVGLVKDAEPLADQPVFADAMAEHQRHVVNMADQLEPFDVNLSARQVQRGEKLLVGRGRGVGQECLTERVPGERFEILVAHVDHRCLP
ncbi:Uncharacterised protein [Mycobacterium tuberculosis]|nr:Uncharacterised protein [Mycobacterium tuberculosis]COY34212.1 Uncharacterised protein [Mycobacterium tuberculosis]